MLRSPSAIPRIYENITIHCLLVAKYRHGPRQRGLSWNILPAGKLSGGEPKKPVRDNYVKVGSIN